MVDGVKRTLPSMAFSTFERISDEESDMDQGPDEYGVKNSNFEKLSDSEDDNEVGDAEDFNIFDEDLLFEKLSKYKAEYFKYNQEKLKDLMRIKKDYDRICKCEELFPELEMIRRLRMIDTTQVAIESFVNIAIYYSYPPSPLLQLMYDTFVSLPISASTVRLGIFYVYNHLIQVYTNPGMWTHPVSFSEVGLHKFCIPAIIHTNNIKCNNIVHICTCINIWRQRQIYSSQACDELENITTNTSVIQKSQFVDKNFTINNELGDLKTLKYLLHMPFVDVVYNEAIADCNVDEIINSDLNKENKEIERALANNKDILFHKSNRLSGQELIILHSASLDLSALIEENNANFVFLQKEIDKLNMLLHGK